MSKHEKFILTPITIECENVISATSLLGTDINTFPACEYILHSLFLKMTGFQEQKFKCIAWEMGTEDFDFRRDLLDQNLKLGEYSTYDSKNAIYKRLLKIIKEHNPILKALAKDPQKYNIEKRKDSKENKNYAASLVIDHICSNENIDKKVLLKESTDKIIELFKNTNISFGDHRKYLYYSRKCSTIFTERQFLTDDANLFNNILQKYYEELYDERNRMAHNVYSYQENLPSLITLKDEDFFSRNYFLYFAILTLIDNVFIELYKVFKKTINDFDY